MKHWLQRALRRFIFTPDPSLAIAGVHAEVLLIRGDDGRPLVAIDKRGSLGVTQFVMGYDALWLKAEAEAVARSRQGLNAAAGIGGDAVTTTSKGSNSALV
jgi:hypothetical protein